MLKKILFGAAAPLTVLGALALGGAAHAATPAPTTVNSVTQVSNRPDNGHGTPSLWAYDTFGRTLTVTLDAPQPSVGVPAGDLAYTATVSDKGTFTAIQGAGAPNASTAALKIASPVSGDLTGTISYTIVAPASDTLTGTVPAAEDDNFSTGTAGFVSTGNWPQQAFGTPANAIVTSGAYSWAYSTACETWTDSSSNGDGNLPADGNITGKTCPVTTPTPTPTPTGTDTHVPFVYGGNVVKVDNNTATVSWSESAKGWPDSTSKCVEVWISGYGFGQWNQNDPANPGTAHVGFTCDHSGTNTGYGYLRGLTRGHTYAERIVPATGTYGSNKPIPGAHVGYVDVFTTDN